MKLITDTQHAELLANARAVLHAAELGTEFDPKPVVKFFSRDGFYCWLLSEMDPRGSDLAYGLCDSGDGRPYMGYVRLSDLEKPQDKLALRVERDPRFVADKPMSVYIHIAVTRGHIIT
jgi:Protein of unknown function (DUF2958)